MPGRRFGLICICIVRSIVTLDHGRVLRGMHLCIQISKQENYNNAFAEVRVTVFKLDWHSKCYRASRSTWSSSSMSNSANVCEGCTRSPSNVSTICLP
jgi:hypothetical protein